MAKIAVLFAAGDTRPAKYVVNYLTECWREAGHEVIYLVGIDSFVPADLLLLHVNLSIVPSAYLRFADRYPKVLNRRVTDIRKSRISKLIVRPSDQWSGPVIVKSDLNSAGKPEKDLTRTWLERRVPALRGVRKKAEKIIRRHTALLPRISYEVYPSLGQVPEGVLRSRHWVVERFLPEMQNGLYHLRMYQCLGDRYLSTRVSSAHGVIKVANSTSISDIEPHPIVDQWRRDFGLDYGKLDYLVHNGEPILLDVNKTTGAVTGPRSDADLDARRRYLATGIDAFL